MHFGRPREPQIEPGASPPADWPPVERVPVGRGPRPERAGIGDALEVPIERIGDGRKLRAGLVVVAGAVFVAGATLLSAFGYGGSSRTAPSAATAVAPASPATVARGQADVIVPGPPPFDWYDPAWQSVDWSAIGIPDGHQGWGVAAASVPLKMAARPTPPAPQPEIPASRPEIRWMSIHSPTERVIVSLPTSRRVYAFAITWPQSLAVEGVSVDYIGSPDDPFYVNALKAFTEISPLPATVVVGTAAPPQPTPRAQTGPSVPSGQFWVPPTVVSPFGDPASPSSSWRFLPWPWPLGDYKVTIATGSGSDTLVLSLQATS